MAQLTMSEREVISKMRFAGASPAEISRTLGRHRSTVSRELARNGEGPDYSAVTAQQKADVRRRERPLVRKMEQPHLSEYVREHLVERWSPDQIAGRLQREHPRDRLWSLCGQTIYRWIQAQPVDDRRHWQQFLRWKGRRKPRQDRRGRLPAQVHIANRPVIVDRRGRYGDWEGDTIVGRRHRGGVVTLVERKSGYLLTGKVRDRQAERVRRTIARLVDPLPSSLRRTLTLDNGKEFAQHARLSRETQLRVYFAEPYRPQQRGTNENTNGLLRQYYPKGTDFHDISRHHIERTTTELNNRPRKRLNYQTPSEVLTKLPAVAFEM